MPPMLSGGLSYENWWQWVGSLALLAFVAGLIEQRVVVAASLVSLGMPVAYIPYDLYGYAYRPDPLELRWDVFTNTEDILLFAIAVAWYFCEGLVLTTLPAVAGRRASREWGRIRKARRMPA